MRTFVKVLVTVFTFVAASITVINRSKKAQKLVGKTMTDACQTTEDKTLAAAKASLRFTNNTAGKIRNAASTEAAALFSAGASARKAHNAARTQVAREQAAIQEVFGAARRTPAERLAAAK